MIDNADKDGQWHHYHTQMTLPDFQRGLDEVAELVFNGKLNLSDFHTSVLAGAIVLAKSTLDTTVANAKQTPTS